MKYSLLISLFVMSGIAYGGLSGGFKWDSTNPVIPIKARANVDLNGYGFVSDDENFTVTHSGAGGIQFVDGSEGTASQCWLSQDIFGTGGWSPCPAGGISNVVEDTTPQSGGPWDVNGNPIVSVSNGNIDIVPDGTGVIRFQDGSQGTSGHVWTSTGTLGEGNWSAPAPAGISEVSADLTPQFGGDIDLNTFKVTEGATRVLHLTGSSNAWFGENAGNLSVTGTFNLGAGTDAGKSLTSGAGNVFLGPNAGENATNGNNTVLIGNGAGFVAANTTDSVGIGTNVFLSTTGTKNVAVGREAGKSLTTGGSNTLIGFRAGEDLTGTQTNTYIGFQAAKNDAAGGATGANVCVGADCGATLSGGIAVTLVGAGANVNAAGVDDAVAVGTSAQVADDSVAIGRTTTALFTNSMALGATAVVDAANKARIGNDSMTTIEFAPGATIGSATGDTTITSAVPQMSKQTADPCGTFPEGTMFYNDTSNYMCYCDGTNDVQVHSPATACF